MHTRTETNACIHVLQMQYDYSMKAQPRLVHSQQAVCVGAMQLDALEEDVLWGSWCAGDEAAAPRRGNLTCSTK